MLTLYWQGILRRFARQRLRSALTNLGMMIAVAAVMTVLSIGEGAAQRVETELNTMGVQRIWITANREEGGALRLQDAALLQRCMPDEKVTALIRRSGTVTGRYSDDVTVTFCQANLKEVEEIGLRYGRFFSSGEEDGRAACAIVDETAARALWGREQCLAKEVKVGGISFRVVGVAASPENENAHAVGNVYIPISWYDTMEGGETLDEIEVRTESRENVLAAQQYAVRILEKGAKVPVVANNLVEEAEAAHAIVETVRNLVLCVAAVSLLVGGIGIMNVMFITVRERQREIGIRYAIGATERQVFWQFLWEALAYSLLGGALGVPTGMLASYWGCHLSGVAVVIPAYAVAAGLIFALGTGILFGVLPALKASRMDPSQALRTDF